MASNSGYPNSLQKFTTSLDHFNVEYDTIFIRVFTHFRKLTKRYVMHTAQPVAGVAPNIGGSPAALRNFIDNGDSFGYDYGDLRNCVGHMARQCCYHCRVDAAVQSILRRVKTCILYCTPGYPTESSYAPLTRRTLRAGVVNHHQYIAHLTPQKFTQLSQRPHVIRQMCLGSIAAQRGRSDTRSLFNITIRPVAPVLAFLGFQQFSKTVLYWTHDHTPLGCNCSIPIINGNISSSQLSDCRYRLRKNSLLTSLTKCAKVELSMKTNLASGVTS